jgi:hypothetical protein
VPHSVRFVDESARIQVRAVAMVRRTRLRDQITTLIRVLGAVLISAPVPLAGHPLPSTVCSTSCLVHQDIISCRRFDRDDLMACYRAHPSATVLDLSYIVVGEPLTDRSLTGLNGIAIVYLDGTRFRSPVDARSLAAMPKLRTVYLRRMRTPIDALIEAVVTSGSVREVALAENFVVCSCSWVGVVARLAGNDVAIIDWDETAPRCAGDIVQKCLKARSTRPTEDYGIPLNGVLHVIFSKYAGSRDACLA